MTKSPKIKWVALLWLLGGLGLGSACSEDQAPYNRLNSLRVLAIRSEPPVPLPGQEATLSALVYAPVPGATPADLPVDDPSLTYAWSWCPAPGLATDSYPCLVSEADVQAFIGGGAVPDFDLGSGPTAKLSHVIDPAVLKSKLCSGMVGLVAPDCTGGLAIQIKLIVTTGTDSVTAVFRTRWALDDQDFHANPVINGLNAIVAGDTRIALGPDNPNGIVFVRDEENNMELEEAVSSQWETYSGLDENDKPADNLQERLFVSWFVETGTTDQESTGLIPGKSDPKVFRENAWTPQTKKDSALERARIFLVIRDNRSGVGWLPAPLLVDLKDPEIQP